MTLRLEPVLVDTGSDDEDGRLVFWNDRLVAVLVRLSDQHDSLAGSWFVESSFGIREGHRTFPDLPTAQEWISGAVSSARR